MNRDEHIEADVALLFALRFPAVGAESSPGWDFLTTGCTEVGYL